jgi:hypothetical protein
MRPFSSAMSEHQSACREVGKPAMKPRLFANANCECCTVIVAPSEFLSLRESAKAAASQRRAISIASPGSRCQGWNRSRSGVARASSAGSGGPAQSSSAVWRAIAIAAATACSSAAAEKSELPAWPRLACGRSPR